MYTAVNLSRYIINKCIADGYPISNLQLQKILYYIQKKFLARGKVAFSDDIEAWPFGPAVASTYYYYCHFGGMPISISEPVFEVAAYDKKLIDRIVETKRELPPWDLAAEIQLPDGAWARTYRAGQRCREVIPLDLIRQES